MVAALGQPFKNALRVTTLKAPANAWDVQIATSTDAGVKKGDVLLCRLYARAIKGQAETGEARITFVMECNYAPYTKSVEFDIACPRDWTRFDIPFTAVEDLDAAQVGINIRVGQGVQTVEIGGIEVVNYAATVALKDLPRTKGSYAGMGSGCGMANRCDGTY